MAQCVFRDGTVISDFGNPYIVSEVNSSHRGNLDTARKMIESSVDIGCDCVKFQSWSVDSLYSKSYYASNPVGRKIVQKVSLTPAQLKEMSEYCSALKISFSSTPYSEEEVDFLVNECNVPYVKIASMEINNLNFLRYIGSKNVPIVLSTGMSDISEVERAVKVLEDSGADQMVLLHCVSIYPTVLKDVNLNNILGLREKFPKYPIGFSDHTEGDAASIAAVALGAGLIEKHLTLDKSKIGMDNGMATEPEQFKELVIKCKNIHIALGRKERVVSDQELAQRKSMRRSLFAAVDIPKGHFISENDLYAKRPGIGIAPDKMDLVLGKLSKRSIPVDSLLEMDDFY